MSTIADSATMTWAFSISRSLPHNASLTAGQAPQLEAADVAERPGGHLYGADRLRLAQTPERSHPSCEFISVDCVPLSIVRNVAIGSGSARPRTVSASTHSSHPRLKCHACRRKGSCLAMLF